MHCSDAKVYFEWIKDTFDRAVDEGLFDANGVKRALEEAKDANRERQGKLVLRYVEERGLKDEQYVVRAQRRPDES